MMARRIFSIRRAREDREARAKGEISAPVARRRENEGARPGGRSRQCEHAS